MRVRRLVPLLVAALCFAYVFTRVPVGLLWTTLRSAEYPRFLAFMIPNAIAYFCWDTLVLSVAINWFHGPVRYGQLLPARAVSYVVALFNTNVARAALAAYLARRLREPFLRMGSTVLFLVLTEMTHLVAWAALGSLFAGGDARRDVLRIVPAVVAAWVLLVAYTRFGIGPVSAVEALIGRRQPVRAGAGVRDWDIVRTFRIAPVRRYVQTVLLRAPMFFASLVCHYFAAQAFGISVPFADMLVYLPVVFMIAALPVTVAHLGTTQAAWVFFFSSFAAPARLLAFSLAAHVTFTFSRALLGVAFIPVGLRELRARNAIR